MRALVRRVSSARVEVSNQSVGSIADGLLVYLGVHRDDETKDVDWTVTKMLGLRIFEDSKGKMNESVNPRQGILVISQFTLLGNLRKGFRPSFNHAAQTDKGRNFYEEFLTAVRGRFEGIVQTGIFGADMQITAVDDGPVTIWLDSRDRKY